MLNTENGTSLLALTAQIVAAHVGHNDVAPGDISKLIKDVHSTLLEASNISVVPRTTTVAAEPTALTSTDISQQTSEAEPPKPAVPPEESIFPDFIICLEDGQRLKTLRRHLKSAFNMTPEQYREKWNLDANYPMVAPNYSEVRSALAKASRLGGGPIAALPAPAPEPEIARTPELVGASSVAEPASRPARARRAAPPASKKKAAAKPGPKRK